MLYICCFGVLGAIRLTEPLLFDKSFFFMLILDRSQFDNSMHREAVIIG